MGMYTELVLGVELESPPARLVATLQEMVNEEEWSDLPGRWGWMLQSTSYYFAGDSYSTLRWDDISDSYFLTVRCDLKNYEGEIESFLQWIAPYVQPRGFAGYVRYEEDAVPTLLYFVAKGELVSARAGLTQPTVDA